MTGVGAVAELAALSSAHHCQAPGLRERSATSAWLIAERRCVWSSLAKQNECGKRLSGC